MNDKLAIIIPAYKNAFLDKVLESLASQTCQNFTVYIGDDASPYDIISIVDKYREKLDIVYHRFKENLGGKDLVGQWERCISLSRREAWIWLFSDDDELDSSCVELFYKEIESACNFDLYHFDVEVIDTNSRVIFHPKEYPAIIDIKDFITRRLRGKIRTYVVEYVFSRVKLEEVKGFQNFDMAWGSDDATWIKMGRNYGIKTISGAKVRWRASNQNISPNKNDYKLVKRKINANLEYITWLNSFFDKSRLFRLKLKFHEITWFCTNLISYSKVIKDNEQNLYIKQLQSILNNHWFLNFFIHTYFKLAK